MDILAHKLNIINRLLMVKDERILLTIDNLLTYGNNQAEVKDEPDFWLELSDAQKQKISSAIEEANKHQVTDGVTLIKKLRKSIKQNEL